MKKEELITNKGFSTLEILIAFAVVITAIVAAVMLSFGNQSVMVDTELSNQALYKAKDALEEARADAVNDFGSLVSTSVVIDDIYEKSISVVGISPCTKSVTSNVTWYRSIREQHINLATVISSISEYEAYGGDCENTYPDPTSWKYPTSLGSVDIVPAGNVSTGIDVVDGIVYLSTKHSNASNPDFFVIDATDPYNLPAAGTNPSIDTGPGLNAVDAAGNYAYVASDGDEEQLQVIDVTIISNPILVATSTLPVSTEGQSIFYLDNKVYIGTFTVTGSEFYVYDVTDPLSPSLLGDLNLDTDIHEINVRGDYAYLATASSTAELIIIDVSNPGSMTVDTNMTFDAAGDEDAYSLYVLGDRIYLGMERSVTNPEFYILDSMDKANISILGSINLGLKNNTEIVGVRVSGFLAFLSLTDSTDGFKVLDISDVTDIDDSWAIYNYSEKATGIDYENNYIYTSNESNDALRILYDCPSC